MGDEEQSTGAVESNEVQPATTSANNEARTDDAAKSTTTKKVVCRKQSHAKRKSAEKVRGKKVSADTDGSTGESDTESDSDSESSSEDEHAKRRAKKKATHAKKAAKREKQRKLVSEAGSDSDEATTDECSSVDERRRKRAKQKQAKQAKAMAKFLKKAGKQKRKRKGRKSDDDSESDSSDSDASDSSSEDEAPKRKRSSVKKSKRKPAPDDSDDSTSNDGSSDEPMSGLQAQIDALILRKRLMGKQSKAARSASHVDKAAKGKKRLSKECDMPSYKRVDQLWDKHEHRYKLKESIEDDDSEFADHAFLVRRCFDCNNKYSHTVVDVKSKQLRAVLTEIMKGCKSVSLEAEEPVIDPNVLFLYLEEMRSYRITLKNQIKGEKKRKVVKKLEQQRLHCKTLIGFLDQDYRHITKTLYPLLEAGNITFDLLWAIFKPNEIVITSCYGVWDEPRCFRVDYATKCESMQRGDWYCVEGRYLEYDGKDLGYGEFEIDVDGFKGPRKITSLSTYPLKYHKDPAGMRKKLVERGMRFVSAEGMQYRFHKGLAFMKKKKQVLKVNINGRVMIDPAMFRRINPNYPISLIKARESEDLIDGSEDDSEGCSCCTSDKESAFGEQGELRNDDGSEEKPKFKYKFVKDEDGQPCKVWVEVDENGDPLRNQHVDQIAEGLDSRNRQYTEEELLLTSPVVLGFAFSEKLWLEFSLSGVHDITYNENAFDSLVLPPDQKDIVRALVESHKHNAARTIDDVVQGKGKGLVAVLHGPPGTGKTLTAEGISELLKCPLYMVSAGELGTDPARLEHQLQSILDIAHAWGAVLLLDEADVFLEKREVHDVVRNSLVSIFLRLLEYFQGILFLTTNRVDTFDEAFQSRIHLPLRYGELTSKAKKTVWTTFLDLVRKSDSESVADFSDNDMDALSRRQLNGRQIKNAVRTAQALALREKTKLSMEHVKKVLDVSETFERDLKGGTGYVEAMRSYT